MALRAAGDAARGATLYVTLEPCAHQSERGPACADLVASAGLARVVVGCHDPDPRTAGAGIARVKATGIPVELIDHPQFRASLSGFLTRCTHGRPEVTLKLALSADCRLAPPQGQWLTSEIARAHTHAWRAKMDAILVGRGTLDADSPRLDVRLPGLGNRSPPRWLLTRGAAPEGWHALPSPQDIALLAPAQYLMVEGGAQTARAFLAADLVDRMMLYRAPQMVGGNGAALPELDELELAGSERWVRVDSRPLGKDRLDVYERK